MFHERRTLCLIASALTLALLPCPSRAEDPPARPVDPGQRLERTCFQTHARWDARLQLRSDVAVCYGIDASLPERIAQWKAQGYVVHLMTGVSWGQYQDYLYGRFDGVRPRRRGPERPQWQGDLAWRRRLLHVARRELRQVPLPGSQARDGRRRARRSTSKSPSSGSAAATAKGSSASGRRITARTGSPPTRRPTPSTVPRSSSISSIGRALKQVFDFVKAENARTGRKVKCYVPTHSLINYAHWQIVSPESSLIKVGADGFIAQVWTGTARTPNVYKGETKERTFEAAFFEYGAMMNVVHANGGTVWFLNDPIEDNPNHSWIDYKTNWESTLTASLLWPQVWRYEVMPWPERIFRGRYPTVDRALPQAAASGSQRIPIPPAYATELMTVINALNDMDQKEVAWDCGTRGIGVVVSDSMMFQRGEPNPSDKNLGSFYGLAMPLVKHGIPAEPVQLENATTPGALAPHKVLLMTYEGMKPMTPDVHDALADWVKQGGVLVFLGDDSDPYNARPRLVERPQGGQDATRPPASTCSSSWACPGRRRRAAQGRQGVRCLRHRQPRLADLPDRRRRSLLALVAAPASRSAWPTRDEPPGAPPRALRRRGRPRRVDRRPGRRPERPVPRPLRRRACRRSTS